jgi:hypothetical protein
MVCGVVKMVDMDWYRKTMNFVCNKHHVVHAASLISRYYSTKNHMVRRSGWWSWQVDINDASAMAHTSITNFTRLVNVKVHKTCVFSRIA